MASYYQQTFNGYTQNEREVRNHPVELSGSRQSVGIGGERVMGKPAPGEFIELRMLDAEKRARGDRPISEMGLTLTIEEAESLEDWLRKEISDARNKLA